MDLTVQTEIFSEFKNVNELSEALNMLKTVINYAKAISADPSVQLVQFLKKIYVDNSLKNFESTLKSNV